MVKLIELFPDIAQLIVDYFHPGWPGIAQKVAELEVVDRCRCEDDFCATVCTAPPPKGAYGRRLRNYQMDTDDGSIIVLDVVGRRIMCVEILFRPGARERLLAVCP